MLFDNEINERLALERKEFVRYLGIIIDNHLSWKHHIELVAIKISYAIGLISKVRHFVPKTTLLKISIYHSIVAPYLTYGLLVWGQASNSYLEKLLKLQKRAHRLIYFSDHYQHAVPLFTDARVLPIQYTYYELIANLMFDIRHNNTPSNIGALFQDVSILISILIIITPVPSPTVTFVNQILDSLFN